MGASAQVIVLSFILVGALGLIVFYSWKAVSYVAKGTRDLIKGGKIEPDRS